MHNKENSTAYNRIALVRELKNKKISFAAPASQQKRPHSLFFSKSWTLKHVFFFQFTWRRMLSPDNTRFPFQLTGVNELPKLVPRLIADKRLNKYLNQPWLAQEIVKIN